MKRVWAGLATAALVAACSPAAEPEGAPSPEVTRGSARELRNPVFVHQLRKGADAYRLEAYRRLPRPAGGARGPGERLRVALGELVAGPTRRERRDGYTSAFSKDSADVVLRAELRGRRAVVDFRDFRQEHGQWSTSYGGTQFLLQLTRTVFEVRRVKSILFRIERSCARFWTFLQAGGCEIVHRGKPRTQRGEDA